MRGKEQGDHGSVGSGLTPLVPSPSASGLIAQPSEGAFPWQQEPDRLDWTDEASGLQCRVVRGPVGALCGYVAVPASHPAHGMGYYSNGYTAEAVLSGEAARTAKARIALDNVEVHGGLTWAGALDSSEHWFGFDCAHAGDFSPKCDTLDQLGRPTGWGTTTQYRDLAYVQEQVRSLAAQLAAMTPEGVATTPTADGEASKPKARATEPKSSNPSSHTEESKP